MRRIAQWYAVEAEIRGHDSEARRRERQARSTPLIAELKTWLEKQLATVSRKSTLAEAIRYALSRWEGLTLFLDDGRVEINSNSVERSIRPLALTRKSALFVGSDGGGGRWRRALGDHRVAGGNLQAQRCRSAGLVHRCPDQTRQRASDHQAR
ncbi:hypothetical protein J2847_006666 [Azospirillum agricola]|nr:hypothetical protein [Azospirillum agricola]